MSGKNICASKVFCGHRVPQITAFPLTPEEIPSSKCDNLRPLPREDGEESLSSIFLKTVSSLNLRISMTRRGIRTFDAGACLRWELASEIVWFEWVKFQPIILDPKSNLLNLKSWLFVVIQVLNLLWMLHN